MTNLSPVTVASVSVLMYQFKCHIFIILKGQFTVPYAVVRNLSAISLADFTRAPFACEFITFLAMALPKVPVLLFFCCLVGKSSVWIEGLATGGGCNCDCNEITFCVKPTSNCSHLFYLQIYSFLNLLDHRHQHYWCFHWIHDNFHSHLNNLN